LVTVKWLRYCASRDKIFVKHQRSKIVNIVQVNVMKRLICSGIFNHQFITDVLLSVQKVITDTNMSIFGVGILA